jgi:hypothetical protein
MRSDPNLLAGWIAFLAGILSGALMGLWFHDEAWLGGYGSFRRRMIRLGHISFFGLGLLNVVFALTSALVPFPPLIEEISSKGLLLGLVSMPACCFLSACRKQLRVLFPIPVASVGVAIIAVLSGWPGR